MKHLQRLFCVLLCFVLLSVGFSIPVSAADEEEVAPVDALKVANFVNYGSYWNENILIGGMNNVKYYYGTLTAPITTLSTSFNVYSTEYTVIFEKGRGVKLNIENIDCFHYFTKTIDGVAREVYTTSSKADQVSVRLYYTDGTTEDFKNTVSVVYSDRTQKYTYTATFTPTKDVEKAVITEYFLNVNTKDITETFEGNTSEFSNVFKDNLPVNYSFYLTGSPVLTTTIQSEEAGLLSGLLGWVTNIFNKVGDIFDTVSSGFANIGTWFAELPVKLWTAISDGLKGLFVPDEEYMSGYSDKWDQLLSQRLGAVYQVCNIVTDSWDGIMNSDQQNTIALPNVTIPLPDGNSFSFGGQDVQIVPDGFTVLVDGVKLILGIVCTYLFVNGLLKRYDEVMGGN